jgi:hypothetical protein
MMRRLTVIAIAVSAVVLSSIGPIAGDEGNKKLLLVEQDKIVSFDPATGLGSSVGTVTGRINGTSTVNFQWTVTAFPNFNIDQRIGITDVDGDQIIFKNVGTGRFVLPGLNDPSLPPAMPPFQVFLNGLGGPLAGTYEVVATSGKFQSEFPIGQTFPYRAVVYNPSSPPSPPGSLGSFYVEVPMK